MYSSLPLVMRFALKVYARGDCWEWRGAKNRLGYGDFCITQGEHTAAHRFAYELAKGPIPRGWDVDHLCRHPWCVRPSHLEAVPHRTNILRGVSPAAKRFRQTACRKGHSLSGRNLIVERPGTRRCRTCKNLRRRKGARQG